MDDKDLIECWLVWIAHNNLDFTSNKDFRECIFTLVERTRADEIAAIREGVEKLPFYPVHSFNETSVDMVSKKAVLALLGLGGGKK